MTSVFGAAHRAQICGWTSSTDSPGARYRGTVYAAANVRTRQVRSIGAGGDVPGGTTGP